MAVGKEVLAVDLDDNIVECDRPLRLWAAETRDVFLEDKDRIPGVFYYHDAFPNSGLTEETSWQLVGDYMWEASLERSVPVENAVEVMAALAEDYEIHIVTARPREQWSVTGFLVGKYFGKYVEELHMPFIESDPERSEAKSAVCRAIGAVAIVDDGKHNIEEVIEGTGGRTKGILHRAKFHSHNHGDVHPDAIIVPDLMTVLWINEQRKKNGRWPRQSEIESYLLSRTDTEGEGDDLRPNRGDLWTP